MDELDELLKAEIQAIWLQHEARQLYQQFLDSKRREEERRRDFIIKYPKFFPEVLPRGVHLINLHVADFTFKHMAKQHRVTKLPRIRWCNQPTATDWMILDQEREFCSDGVFDDRDFLGLWQPIARQIWLRADQHPRTVVHTAAHEFCHFITGTTNEEACCRFAAMVSKDVEYDLAPYYDYVNGQKYEPCHRCG